MSSNSKDPRGHMKYLEEIAREDAQILVQKESEYGSSWKSRGGIGAFMMLARKWDRLEQALDPAKRPGGTHESQTVAPLGLALGLPIPAFDILLAAVLDTRNEGIIDDIGDLRRYLLLVEAQARYEQQEVIGAKPD